MNKWECTICGVAYNTGCRSCKEIDCLAKVLEEHPELRKYEKYEKPHVNSDKPKRVVIKSQAKQRLDSILGRGKKKNIPVTVILEDIEAILREPCVYCGSIERIEVDRKDSSGGYTRDNIAPACRRCNTIKNNVVSYEEMLIIAKTLGWN
jgi:hypothetical protein